MTSSMFPQHYTETSVSRISHHTVMHSNHSIRSRSTSGNSTTNKKPKPKKHKKSISHPMITNVSKLLELLSTNNCLVDIREGLQTFLIYLSNIIKHPHDKKYRRIRIGNANYQIRLGHLHYGQELLRSIGYEIVQNKYLILPPQLFTQENEKYIITAIRNLAVFKLEVVKKKFQNVPRIYEVNHRWISVKHATEAHTIGRRQNMEDDHLLIDCFTGKEDMGFFGIYDGHGGRRTVDFLTCAFHLNLEHYLKCNPKLSMLRALDDCYSLTDKQIHRQQIYQSGATAVTCVIANEECKRVLYVANAGDTRCVLCRAGKALRLTKDHKADDREEALMIKNAGGKIGRMKRVNGLLAVTRAFGDHLLKPPITVSPTLLRVELNVDTDYFFIIGCDGVWDVMSDVEVIEYIYIQLMRRSNVISFKDITRKDCERYLHQICLDIVKNAIDRRSQDNISVMIVVV